MIIYVMDKDENVRKSYDAILKKNYPKSKITIFDDLDRLLLAVRGNLPNVIFMDAEAENAFSVATQILNINSRQSIVYVSERADIDALVPKTSISLHLRKPITDRGVKEQFSRLRHPLFRFSVGT